MKRTMSETDAEQTFGDDVVNNLPYPPNGFSSVQGASDYWLDAVRDFWAETGLDTDDSDVHTIVAWFDKRRAALANKEDK